MMPQHILVERVRNEQHSLRSKKSEKFSLETIKSDFISLLVEQIAMEGNINTVFLFS